MVLTKWDTNTTSKFISLYRDQECLWRTDSSAYRDKDARDAALTNLIIGMNLEDFTIDDAKRKIKHLRSTYMTELKKKEKALQSGASKYKPTLAWFNEMDEFIKYVTRNSSSITENPDSDEQAVSHTKQEMDPDNMDFHAVYFPSVMDRKNTKRKLKFHQKRLAEMQANSPNKMSIKTKKEWPSQTFIKRSCLSKLNSVIKEMEVLTEDFNKVEETNELEIYGKYVGIQLKSMNEEDAIRAQQEIQLILTRYKLKQIQGKPDNPQTPGTSQSQLLDCKPVVSPTDSSRQSRRASHHESPVAVYDNNHSDVQYCVELNDSETVTAVESLSTEGLQ